MERRLDRATLEPNVRFWLELTYQQIEKPMQHQLQLLFEMNLKTCKKKKTKVKKKHPLKLLTSSPFFLEDCKTSFAK